MYAAQARHVRQCLKEVKIVAAIWLAGFVWCATVLIWRGYIPVDQRPDVPALVLGIPSWVFWGLFVPWFVQIGAAWWFAVWVLKDDEPGYEGPAPDVQHVGSALRTDLQQFR